MDKLSIKDAESSEGSRTPSTSDDDRTLSANSNTSLCPLPNSTCTTDSEDSPRNKPMMITIKVKDFIGSFGLIEAQVFIVAPDTTFGEFFIDVSNRFNLQLGDFDIIYQEKSFATNLGSMPEDSTFFDIGITPCPDKIYWMGLDQPQSTRKRKNRSADSASQAIGLDESRDSDIALAAFLDGTAPKRDFVGLKNKNMTCYLNSFIQGLWFTPEFRNGIFNYEYQPGRFNKKSLCLPLQKLFLQQQFSIRDSIDTDELIKTFGWEDRETWNQHDIEELCSIFMENLIAEFRGTPMDGLIQALYFGTLDDYVKCLGCGKVSQRTDDFLVVPLPIKNFGSTVAYPTLEAALNSFVAYEVLDGQNMYNCSQCGVPCPAHKGFKFNRLPYILTIQLKRFEYDFIKDRRLKLNDRVAFPMILDMNPYVENPSPDRKEALKVDLLKPNSLKEGGCRPTHSRPSIPLFEPEFFDALTSQEDGELKEPEGAAGLVGNEYVAKILQELVKTKGPEMYQLFGVMVHRGGINSGHYYAYILDFERGTWFRCDDAVVRPASVADIEGAYGGATDDDRELTSAYMLLYRRFDLELNMLPYYLEEMPAHMQEMWKVTAALDQQIHEEEEVAKNTVRMVCYYDDGNPCCGLLEKPIQIPKTMCMVDVGPFVFKEMTEKQKAPACHNVRVVRYDRDLEIIENSFEGYEEDPIVSVLRKRPPVTKNEGFLLEVKEDCQHFITYHHDDIVFRTHIVDNVLQEVFPPLEVHVHPSASVADLKANVIFRFGLIPKEEMWLVAHFSDRYCPVAGDKYPLNLYKFDKINHLYVTFGSNESLGEALLDFVEQYTKAEVTQIFVQVPETFAGIPSKKAEKANESGKPEDAKSIESNAVAAASVVVETPPAPSNSENAIKAEKLPEPIAEGEASVPVVSEAKAPSQQLAREYFVKFSNQAETEEPNVLCFTLRIDGQTPLYALSKSISELIAVEEKDFVIYKVEKSESTEMRRMTERISTIKPFDRLYVKLEHRLQDGEHRIPVFLLSIGCVEKPLELLTEIVVTLGMTLDDLRSTLIEKCEILRSDVAIDKSRIRIRKKLRTSPSKIMREHAKLQDLFSVSSIHVGELFVQVLDEPCPLSDKTYSILYRHWHPSSGILDAPVEITVFHDYSNDLEELILTKLKESMGVGEDVELEAAKPEGGYPWEIPPRVIQDLAWFSLVPPAKKSLYVYSDELALFVRDKKEIAMDFDDMESYRVHNVLKVPTTPTIEQPRRETGLKINLSKSPTKS